ncbi:MAG TPA: hypothetical protein VGK36_08725 [Candidatus Angelobacter sp.]|jgi:hypothetical protein
MSTLAEFPQGIPIPADEIRSALMSAAIPGFTGTLRTKFYLTPNAASCVRVDVLWDEAKRTDTPEKRKQTLPDPDRRKPVQKVIEDIENLLFVRTVLVAVEAHYLDGVLTGWRKIS